MTYHKYGLIQATTYNAYAAIINSIFADTNAGSIIESSADYGYGQSTSVATVASGNNITAAQWTALFSKISSCGTHQGTSVTPIPSSVSTGSLIAAYNDYLTTTTLTDVISSLIANRLQVAVGQRSTIAGPSSPSSPTWTNGLRYQFLMDFGSWDNARHFFNTGGAITFAGTGTSGSTEDNFWQTMLSNMGTLQVIWHDTIPSIGAGSTTGFYDLTNTGYTKVWQGPAYGGSPVVYSNNYISIYGQLVNAPGTDGQVNFRVELIDNDPTPNSKTAGKISYQIGVMQSAGTIPYPGPAVTINAGTFSAISSTGVTAIPLTLTSVPTTLSGKVTGAGTATTASITITPAGGTGPYTYAWINVNSPPLGAVTFSAASSATTTFSRVMADGEVASGTAKCTVTDSLSVNTYILINWSLNSNSPNVVGT